MTRESINRAAEEAARRVEVHRADLDESVQWVLDAHHMPDDMAIEVKVETERLLRHARNVRSEKLDWWGIFAMIGSVALFSIVMTVFIFCMFAILLIEIVAGRERAADAVALFVMCLFLAILWPYLAAPAIRAMMDYLYIPKGPARFWCVFALVVVAVVIFALVVILV